MSTHPFNGPEYDQPDYHGSIRSYMICTAPRCGGTLLSSLLQQSAQLGVPHEYLHVDSAALNLQERWQLPTPLKTSDYLAQCYKKRTTPNGVFGIKIHYNQCHKFQKDGYFVEFLKTVKAAILVRRKDILAQAISFAIAHQTRQWFSTQTPEQKPRYDEKLIRNAVDEILMQYAAWEKFLAFNQIPTHHIYYEDFLLDPAPTGQWLADQMGVQLDRAFSIEQSPLKKQANQINEEWTARFLSEGKRQS
jgi:LPS sulfotransferase NodH